MSTAEYLLNQIAPWGCAAVIKADKGGYYGKVYLRRVHCLITPLKKRKKKKARDEYKSFL